jgi:NitT/TauT family transport system substrate-binding protein
MDSAFVRARPGDVQKLVDAWFDTLAFIAANPDESVAIMAKRAGVDVAAYRDYDAGTTIFSLADNVEAFAPGNDQKHLDFAARQISTFLVESKLVDTPPDIAGLLDPTFVTARAAAG